MESFWGNRETADFRYGYNFFPLGPYFRLEKQYQTRNWGKISVTGGVSANSWFSLDRSKIYLGVKKYLLSQVMEGPFMELRAVCGSSSSGLGNLEKDFSSWIKESRQSIDQVRSHVNNGSSNMASDITIETTNTTPAQVPVSVPVSFSSDLNKSDVHFNLAFGVQDGIKSIERLLGHDNEKSNSFFSRINITPTFGAKFYPNDMKNPKPFFNIGISLV